MSKTTREKIIEELKKYNAPVRYSEFREKFSNSDFLDSLIFLISTGDISIIGYHEKETKYPEEVKKIKRIVKQCDAIVYSVDKIDVDTILSVLDISLKKPKSEVILDVEGKEDPVLIYTPLLADWVKSCIRKDSSKI